MTLRLLEIILPESKVDEILELLQEHECIDTWSGPLTADRFFIRTLLLQTQTEALSDAIQAKSGSAEEIRLLFHSIEATLPQPEVIANPDEPKRSDELNLRLGRISREELYADIVPGAELSAGYLLSVILAAVVAAIGLLFDDVAVIIGAMVIAPLLRPNVALSLAATLGDLKLMKGSLRANGLGSLCAFGLAVLIGFLFSVDAEASQIALRTSISSGNVILALVAGVAGALAFTTGVSASLIGVMVAVALLPPLVTSGLLLGAGHTALAIRALLLAVTNVVAINLATVITFLLQGVGPRRWWKAEKAKQATRIAIIIWVVLLAAFVALAFMMQNPG